MHFVRIEIEPEDPLEAVTPDLLECTRVKRRDNSPLLSVASSALCRDTDYDAVLSINGREQQARSDSVRGKSDYAANSDCM